GKTILMSQLLPVSAALPNTLPVWIDLTTIRVLTPIREIQLPIGVAVKDVIRLALERKIQPILMVDTLDRVDPDEAPILFEGLGDVTVVVADRTAHFSGLEISGTTERIELVELADEHKQKLFRALAANLGLPETTLTGQQLAACPTPLH